MKSIYLGILMFLFGATLTKAQLIELPKSIQGKLYENISAQWEHLSIAKKGDTTIPIQQEYCFVFRVSVKKVSADSVSVTNVVQIQDGVPVHHLKDPGFFKSINFAEITHGRDIKTINIPLYYSMIDKTREGSEKIDGFFNFYFKLKDMVVAKSVSENVLYTMPFSIIGAIYE